MTRLWSGLARGAALLLTARVAAAQDWCVPTTAIPYSRNMPGITHVAVGTINRHSLPIENFPQNSYVNTGATTDFQTGAEYAIVITHTRDSVVFPTVRNNIRVWIDYNKNGSFSDSGETVVRADYVPVGQSRFSFVVPGALAPVTATRMRVTAKMSDEGGHALPTPCDDPPDRLQYHGEIEDYAVSIVAAGRSSTMRERLTHWAVHPTRER